MKHQAFPQRHIMWSHPSSFVTPWWQLGQILDCSFASNFAVASSRSKRSIWDSSMSNSSQVCPSCHGNLWATQVLNPQELHTIIGFGSVWLCPLSQFRPKHITTSGEAFITRYSYLNSGEYIYLKAEVGIDLPSERFLRCVLLHILIGKYLRTIRTIEQMQNTFVEGTLNSTADTIETSHHLMIVVAPVRDL